MNAAKKAGDDEAVAAIAKRHPVEVQLMDDIERADRALRELNKRAVETVGKPERLREIDKERTGIMQQFNTAIKTLEQQQKAAKANATRPESSR